MMVSEGYSYENGSKLSKTDVRVHITGYTCIIPNLKPANIQARNKSDGSIKENIKYPRPANMLNNKLSASSFF